MEVAGDLHQRVMCDAELRGVARERAYRVPRRERRLMALRAAKGAGIPHAGISHKDLVEAMSVTRATVSGLMANLEREGLVKSAVDSDDRRKLIARLTAKGEIIVEDAFGIAMARFGKIFASFSTEELTALTALLSRLRQEFIPLTAHEARSSASPK